MAAACPTTAAHLRLGGYFARCIHGTPRPAQQATRFVIRSNHEFTALQIAHFFPSTAKARKLQSQR